jgi:hypothetical protein
VTGVQTCALPISFNGKVVICSEKNEGVRLAVNIPAAVIFIGTSYSSFLAIDVTGNPRISERYRCFAERSKSSGKMTKPPAERCLLAKAQHEMWFPRSISLPVIARTDS